MMVIRTPGLAAGLLALASAAVAPPHAPATAKPVSTEGKPAAKATPRAALLTLQESLALASGEQPALVAYEREAQASEQEAVAAQSLPELQLTAGIQNFPITGRNALSPTRDEMTMLTVGLMREQVRRSKRRAEAARLTAEALVSRQQGTARQREIGRDVMIAWIDAVEAHSKAALLVDLVANLRTGRKVMEAGIPTGTSTPALALQMESEIALAEGELAEARSAEVRARSELARWIGGGAAARPLPDALPLIEAPKQLPAELLALHPSLQAAEAEQQLARRQVDVARQERGRDVTWSVMLGIRPKYGEMLSGQVSIPLQTNRRNRQDRLIAAAELRADAAGQKLEDARRDLVRRFEVAQADYEGASAELGRIDREAIPALESAFKTAEARFEAGGDSFDQPFQVVRPYVEATIKSVETRAKRDRAVAEMLYVVGETGR